MTPLKDIVGQADRIAAFILNEDRSFIPEWLRWVTQSTPKGQRVKSLPQDYLHFLDERHRNEFKGVLDACKKDDGSLSIYNLRSYLSPERSKSLTAKLGLKWNPASFETEIINRGIGSTLEQFLRERYGITQLAEDAVVMADLLHAAYFTDLADVRDSHKVVRALSNYLSSTSKGGMDLVHEPQRASLDSIIAVFNSYDGRQMIEDILFDIEQQVLFKRIAAATIEHSNAPEKYKGALHTTLDCIITDVKKQREKSELEGSQRILDRLTEKYEALQNFEINGTRTELDGWVFPRFYQAEAVLEIYKNKRFLIADEMGTGKTAISILASEYIAQQEGRDDFKTLVITTNTNKISFAEKIAKYLNLSEEEAAASIGIINGGSRKEQYERAKDARYVVVNYELLRAKDWKLEDYTSWEVEDEKYQEMREEIKRKFRIHNPKRLSEHEFILQNIPRPLRNNLSTDDIDQLYDTYIKVQDLNEAKSVVKSLQHHFNFDHVVVDEIHNAKRSTTLNSKAIKEITNSAEYVTCLTGTPFVNGLSDLGILFEILGVYDDLIAAREKNLQDVAKKAGVTEHHESLEKERKNLAVLTNAIKNGDVAKILLDNPRMVRDYLRPKMLRRRSTDVLKIPNLTFTPPLESSENYSEDALRLPMYQRMAYEILQRHDFGNAAEQLRALQMILLSGGLYQAKFTPGRKKNGAVIPQLPKVIEEHLTDEKSTKYKALEARIEEIVSSDRRKKNVVVFSSLYKQNVTRYLQERLQQEFPDISVLRIDGDVTDSSYGLARTDIIKEFNEPGKPKVLIATGPTMKEAIELHKQCSSVIFLDSPFTWAEYSQEIARVWRADQDEPVNVYNLMVSNSLDVGKLELMLQKRKLGELLLQGYPLNSQELSKLEITEANAASTGLIKDYVDRTIDSSMKVMRDLYGSGAEKALSHLGEKNKRSEVYADAYILNLMSVACLKSITQDLLELNKIDDNISSLDGKVLDLAAGYGSFAHVTSIKTENLELNPFMIERAKEYSPSAHYTQGLMQDVNKIYGDERFENIIYSLAFHYAADEEKGKLLYNLHRTLKPQGYLYLTESTGSIDTQGRERLAEALQQTGYSVVKNEEVHCGDKTFYKIVAQKTAEGRLYDAPFKLREFIDEQEDLEGMIDLKEMYVPAEEVVQEGLPWGAEFGGKFAELIQ